MRQKDASANAPTALNCIGYSIDIEARPPTQADMSRLRHLWLLYGTACLAAGAGSAWLLTRQLPIEQSPGLALLLIFLTATSVSCAGLAFVMSFVAFRPVSAYGQPDLTAVELACQDSPAAAAYMEAAMEQGRPITSIEANAMLAAAGYRYVWDQRAILTRGFEPSASNPNKALETRRSSSIDS